MFVSCVSCVRRGLSDELITCSGKVIPGLSPIWAVAPQKREKEKEREVTGGWKQLQYEKLHTTYYS